MTPRLWRYCVVLTKSSDIAHDLTQSTCLRALEKAHQFEKGTHLDRWVFRIAQRIWFNELRAKSVRHGGGIVAVEDANLPSNEPSAETNIFVSEVLSHVQALPEAQRTTVMLVYVEGFSYREAADVLQIPIGTVMSRLSAARKTLKTNLPLSESRIA
ncbi:MAG: RNA polymerase sigma factor [Litoreibacter sp.]|uniref:RNA polymerase sigma factor n=1 Tax=Litoreibacter sp. TaxID=1969459 RepID=UPI0032971CDB